MRSLISFFAVLLLVVPSFARPEPSPWHSRARQRLKTYQINILLSDTTFVTDKENSFEAVLVETTNWKNEDKITINNRQQKDWENEGFKFRGREKVDGGKVIRYRTLLDKNKATYVFNEFFFATANRTAAMVALSKLDKESAILKVKNVFQAAFETKSLK